MSSAFVEKFEKYLRATTATIACIILILCFFFNAALLVYVSKLCFLWYRRYKICKQTNKYKCSPMKLYNSKTQFTKYFISILICVVELAAILWVGISALIFESLYSPTQNVMFNKSNFSHEDCRLQRSTLKMYTNQYFIFLLNLNLIFYSLQGYLLSVLTRYLAARYLNHPIKPTLIKYTIWIVVQVVVVAICSSDITAVFSWVLFPIFAITNWLLLLRDSLILSRILKSNLKGIQLFSNDAVFYRQQVIGYKIYKLFRIILLIALFFLVSCLVISEIGFILKFTLDEYCLINLTFHAKISPLFHLAITDRNAIEIITVITQRLSFCLYGLSMSLPIFGISISAIIYKCVKKYKDKEDNYRFNYEKLEPLIGWYRTY